MHESYARLFPVWWPVLLFSVAPFQLCGRFPGLLSQIVLHNMSGDQLSGFTPWPRPNDGGGADADG
jgi:hypothetical protein